jgi:predicted HAD superfamily Cof-like phosphohydrolase
MTYNKFNGMSALLDDVAEFHYATDTPCFSGPAAFPADARIALREKLFNEEYDELLRALAGLDIVEVADALGDLIYVAIGAALEFGIPLDRVWAEIQRTNMAKVDQATGKVTRRADGKILKPEGWTGPRIAEILGDSG